MCRPRLPSSTQGVSRLVDKFPLPSAVTRGTVKRFHPSPRKDTGTAAIASTVFPGTLAKGFP